MLDEPFIGHGGSPVLRDALFQAFADFRRLPLILSAALHMPPGEFMALHRIGAEGPPWECTVSDLSAGTHVSMSAISQSLASLERKGYVTRSMSEQDRRRITVAFTPEGEACARLINGQLERIMRRTVERYGEADMWALLERTRRLIGVMEQVHREIVQEMHTEGENRT